ncbi:MAG: hypothetical protein ACKOW8_09700, partial [Flavobacteriales bacterium]
SMDGSPIIDKTGVEGLYFNGGWCYGGFKATPDLLILSAVFRESEKSLPELAIKKQNTLGKRNSSLEQLDSLYQLGNPESVISFLVDEKSNPEVAVGNNLLKPFENQFTESKQALVKEENKLTSLRNKELETSDDIKSNEAILKRTTDAAERQIVESRLASLQQDLLADRQRILDQKLSIAAANRKVIQSEKLLTILKNPKQEIVAINAQDFTLTAPVTESQFTAMQTELTAKREALLVRDAKVQMMIEEARTETGAPTTTSNESAYAAKESDAATNSQVSDSPINENALSQSSEKVFSADNLTRDEKASGIENIAKLEAKYISELKLAEGRPDSLQIKSAAEYNATSALWVEKIRLEKVLANENATEVDSIKYREVSESAERIAQNSPQRITPLEPAALSNELLRQDPEFIEKKLNLQNNGRAEEALDYKIQLIEQLMLTRSENAAALVKAASSQELTNIAKRDEEIERAVYTLLADDAEIKRVKLEYDSAMKVLIESDMDYPQKLTRQYDLTLKYEKQLARLEEAAAINGVNKETSAIKFVSSERGAVQVKLIAYKKELDRSQPSTQTDVAISSNDSANSERTEGGDSNDGNADSKTNLSPSTNVGENGS